MNCLHTAPVWEETEGWDYDGERVVRRELVSYATTEDVDTHRYKCTQCHEVFYYSGAARRYYEDNVTTPGVMGLENNG